MNLIVGNPEAAPDSSRENLPDNCAQVVNAVELRLMSLARQLRSVERSIRAILVDESLFIVERADNRSLCVYSESHGADFRRRIVDFGEHSVVEQKAMKI